MCEYGHVSVSDPLGAGVTTGCEAPYGCQGAARVACILTPSHLFGPECVYCLRTNSPTGAPIYHPNRIVHSMPCLEAGWAASIPHTQQYHTDFKQSQDTPFCRVLGELPKKTGCSSWVVGGKSPAAGDRSSQWAQVHTAREHPTEQDSPPPRFHHYGVPLGAPPSCQHANGSTFQSACQTERTLRSQ